MLPFVLADGELQNRWCGYNYGTGHRPQGEYDTETTLGAAEGPRHEGERMFKHALRGEFYTFGQERHMTVVVAFEARVEA